MLARLSSTLPSAASSLARSTSVSLPCIISQVRFNSEVAAQAEVPKKRTIPLADSLGDIVILNRPFQDGQRRNGNGNRSGQRIQLARPNNFNRDDERWGGRSDAGQRGQGNGQNVRRNGQPNGGLKAQQPLGENGQQVQSQYVQTEDIAQRQPPQNQRSSSRDRFGKDDDEEEERIIIPAAKTIELGNLDDLFGPPTAATVSRIADVAKPLSPSQHRVQLFLERTAGDYSRYVPKQSATTDVTRLSPLEFSEFVLSKRRDVGLQSRHGALAIVEKFTGTVRERQGEGTVVEG
ncbi:hypothetical protein BD414DRAFT_484532 [Trametes punicea]|nr:hypothetical protein BD414DRAFT_484532 [Trametes punicea]